MDNAEEVQGQSQENFPPEVSAKTSGGKRLVLLLAVLVVFGAGLFVLLRYEQKEWHLSEYSSQTTNTTQEERDARRIDDITRIYETMETISASYKSYPSSAPADHGAIPSTVQEKLLGIDSGLRFNDPDPEGSCGGSYCWVNNTLVSEISSSYCAFAILEREPTNPDHIVLVTIQPFRGPQVTEVLRLPNDAECGYFAITNLDTSSPLPPILQKDGKIGKEHGPWIARTARLDVEQYVDHKLYFSYPRALEYESSAKFSLGEEANLFCVPTSLWFSGVRQTQVNLDGDIVLVKDGAVQTITKDVRMYIAQTFSNVCGRKSDVNIYKTDLENIFLVDTTSYNTEWNHHYLSPQDGVIFSASGRFPVTTDPTIGGLAITTSDGEYKIKVVGDLCEKETIGKQGMLRGITVNGKIATHFDNPPPVECVRRDPDASPVFYPFISMGELYTNRSFDTVSFLLRVNSFAYSQEPLWQEWIVLPLGKLQNTD